MENKGGDRCSLVLVPGHTGVDFNALPEARPWRRSHVRAQIRSTIGTRRCSGCRGPEGDSISDLRKISLSQPLTATNLLSVWVCLSGVFHINGVTQSVTCRH